MCMSNCYNCTHIIGYNCSVAFVAKKKVSVASVSFHPPKRINGSGKDCLNSLEFRFLSIFYFRYFFSFCFCACRFFEIPNNLFFAFAYLSFFLASLPLISPSELILCACVNRIRFTLYVRTALRMRARVCVCDSLLEHFRTLHSQF